MKLMGVDVEGDQQEQELGKVLPVMRIHNKPSKIFEGTRDRLRVPL